MTRRHWVVAVLTVFLSMKAYSAVVQLDCPDAAIVKQEIIKTLIATNCNARQYYFYNSQGIKLGSAFVGGGSKLDESCSQIVQTVQNATITNAGQVCQQQLLPHQVVSCGYNLSNYVVDGINWYWLALQPVDAKYISMLNCSKGRLAVGP